MDSESANSGLSVHTPSEDKLQMHTLYIFKNIILPPLNSVCTANKNMTPTINIRHKTKFTQDKANH